MLSSALGTLAGLTAATFPRLDRVLMRILDGFMAFPAAILAIAMIAALGTGIWQESLALTVVFFPRTARIMRGVGLQLRGRQFVEAAVVVGGTPTQIVLRHILPNALGPLIIQSSFVLGRAIVTDAGLSFLGLGAPPPTPSWGNMLGDARTFMQDAWWFVAFPGVAIVLTVLSVNLLGDAMRDRLDPKLREARIGVTFRVEVWRPASRFASRPRSSYGRRVMQLWPRRLEPRADNCTLAVVSPLQRNMSAIAEACVVRQRSCLHHNRIQPVHRYRGPPITHEARRAR
jgi:ABC-type methionine transport system permease subunit